MEETWISVAMLPFTAVFMPSFGVAMRQTLLGCQSVRSKIAPNRHVFSKR